MGMVYRGHDRVIGRKVAVKILGEGAAKVDDSNARFQREAQVVGQLRHRNVVEVFDFGVDNGRPFMVMELLEGKDLATLLEKRGPISVARAVDIVLGVAAGLSAAHERGLVHRDIKPANIFLSREDGDEIPKILDFGISKTSDSRLTVAGSVFGTQHYVSPEQACNSADVDARTDQYALGVILYQLVTNRPPHDGDNVYAVVKNIVEGNFLPPSRHISGIPAGFEDIIIKAMATEPDGRFASVYEMGVALLPYSSERGKRQWFDFYNSRVAISPEFSVPNSYAGGPLPPAVPGVPVVQIPPTAVLPPASPARWPVVMRQEPTSLLPDSSPRVVHTRSPSPATPLPRLTPRRSLALVLVPAVAVGIVAVATLVFFLVRPKTAEPQNVEAAAATPVVTAPPPSPTHPASEPVPEPSKPNVAAAAPAPSIPNTPNTVHKIAVPKRERPRASRNRRVRYNDDGVPLILP
jgi:serine/threonine-protein kinase